MVFAFRCTGDPAHAFANPCLAAFAEASQMLAHTGRCARVKVGEVARQECMDRRNVEARQAEGNKSRPLTDHVGRKCRG